MIKVFVLLAHIIFANGDMDDIARQPAFKTQELCEMFLKDKAYEEVKMYFTDVQSATFTCKEVQVKDDSI